MRAAYYSRFGGPEVMSVAEVPKPSPKPGEILIRVHASTVSAADYRMRSRDLPEGLGFLAPFMLGFFAPRRNVPGYDTAGVVESIGANVTRFKPGDEVIAMVGGRGGGQGEYTTIAETAAVTRKPRNMSFEEAVTLVFGGGTMAAFFEKAPIKPGDEVLVNGASSATGTAAVQLAKHAGATVAAVCSGANAELVRSLGADHVIDYAKEDFAAGGKLYDMVIDCVGNAPFSRVEHSIKPAGVFVPVVASLGSMLRAGRDARRTGKRILPSGVTPTAAHLASLVDLAEAGAYRPVIDRTYKLEEIVEAHRYLDTWRKKGNIVLKLA